MVLELRCAAWRPQAALYISIESILCSITQPKIYGAFGNIFTAREQLIPQTSPVCLFPLVPEKDM